MKAKPAPTEATLLRLLREAVEWDQGLERDVSEEDLVVPEWRREAEVLLDEVDRA
jgi:hypothetical protein